MNDQTYFEAHIPHRVNLLITFRERYKGATSQQCDSVRDFYRCSKDISMLMVRFFLSEMGIGFRKKAQNSTDDIHQHEPAQRVQKLTCAEVRNDPRFSNVKKVLKAANRAVAHLEDIDVDHPIRQDVDHVILFDAIDFTEEMIIEKIYKPSSYDYSRVMSSEGNDMRRVPLW